MGNQRETKPKREFPAFPFNPYSIQTEFMNFLYDSLDNGDKISMLESPTGTGKTLSIICSALQWLVDRRKNPSLNGSLTTGDDEEPDWMRDFVVTAPDKAKAKKKRETRKKKLGFGFGDSENKSPHSNPNKTQETKSVISEDDESEFLLGDYESEDENGWKRKGRKISDWSSGDDDAEEKKRFFEGKEEEERTPKVFFTSRTHSQLSQFVKEFRRTAFASELNLVCLGSRKNMCINPGNLSGS